MQICCTKDFQKELNIKAEAGLEENDLFCWSVHILTLNRKRAVVVVNDSCRFGFALYGLKVKDMKNLKEHIIQGIKKSFSHEKIKEEVIEKYFEEAGEVTFSKTRGPKFVGRLNKACEILYVLSDRFEPDTFYQAEIAERINHDLVKVSKETDYEYPHVLLLEKLEELAGDKVISCSAVQLLVELKLKKYTAWRRIVTPSDITFNKLHKILQIAFGWKSYHLHNFNMYDKSGKLIESIISEYEEVYDTDNGINLKLDSETKLSEYLNGQYKMLYCYDYGDNWIHEITIEKIYEEYDKNYPFCFMGEGKTPPEDVGGVSGYLEFLNIISDDKHPEYKNTLRWAESAGYKDFYLDQINRILESALRR